MSLLGKPYAHDCVSPKSSRYSPKRKPEDRGTRFKLPECRIWMRLMFLSMRETGAFANPVFEDFLTRLLGRFISIYEVRARKSNPIAHQS